MIHLTKVIIDYITAYLPFETQVQLVQVSPQIKEIVMNLDHYYRGLYLEHTGLEAYPEIPTISAREMFVKAKKYSCYYREHLWVKVPVGIKILGWCRQCRATFYDGKITFYMPNNH